jgi:hypothetical protein
MNPILLRKTQIYLLKTLVKICQLISVSNNKIFLKCPKCKKMKPFKKKIKHRQNMNNLRRI